VWAAPNHLIRQTQLMRAPKTVVLNSTLNKRGFEND
jgi:hypothetical protein